MILKHILFISLLPGLCPTFGQSSWQKRLTWPGTYNDYSRSVIETGPNSYLLCGNALDSVNGQVVNFLTIVGTDSTGTITFRKRYGRNTYSYRTIVGSSTMMIKHQGYLYSAIIAVDSLGKQAGVLLKFNFNGDTIWQKTQYDDDSSSVFYNGVFPSVDQGLFIVGAIENYIPGYNNHPLSALYLRKTDLNGNLLWEKKYFAPNLDDTQFIAKLIQDPVSKKLILVGNHTKNGAMYGEILILDSLGGPTTSFGYNSQLKDGGFMDVVQTSDGNFVAAGAKLTNQLILDMNSSYSQLMKFNLNGTIIFNQLFDTVSIYNSFTRLMELPSGRILTLGCQDIGSKPINSISVLSRLLLVDNNGQYLWSKYFDNYKLIADFDFAFGMDLTFDGKIIFTSCCQDCFENTTYMLYKTDTSDCAENAIGCYRITDTPEQKIITSTFIVSPNPVCSVCNIFLPTNDLNSNYTLELVDSFGRTLENFHLQTNREKINLEKYSNGIYMFRLQKDGQFVNSQKIIINR